MARTLDLDRLSQADVNALSVEVITRLVSALERLPGDHPEQRAAVRRRIAEGVACGRLSDDDAAALRDRLDRMNVGAFLAGHLEDVVGVDVLNGPTIGYYRRAFPRRETPTGPGPLEWLAADPRRLSGVVREMSRFTTDWKAIAGAVAELADGAGIVEEVADEIIASAIRDARKEARRGRAS